MHAEYYLYRHVECCHVHMDAVEFCPVRLREVLTGPRRPMLLDFTAQYFAYGLFIGPSFHSSIFSLPFFFFLSETNFLTGEQWRRRHRVWRPERTHGYPMTLLRGNVFPMCSLLAMCSQCAWGYIFFYALLRQVVWMLRNQTNSDHAQRISSFPFC